MKTWISLNMTPGVGPRAATKLLERFGSAEAVFGARRSELESLRLRPETVESIIRKEFHDKAAEELDTLREMGGDVLVLDDGTYPQLLRETADPPIVLYVKGAWQECLEAPCVAIVGSRRCSTYGQNAAEMLGKDLAGRGVTVVSGFARGIDAAAHRGALVGGGRTVAVMGTGLDMIYPKEHRKLAEEILGGGGALVTQFPLGTPPLKDNFPYRNRIISGLSLGVLVVEATDRSGSLITARLAMEQNREVYAVPGNITSANSYGSNFLIKSAGAKLVQQWQDVVAEFPKEIAAAILPPPLTKNENGTMPVQAELRPADLDAVEQQVWKLLAPDAAVHIDALLEQSGLPITDVTSALVAMEMRDLIRALPGRHFAKKL
ncbi:MAG TPA: DNA-processing protein DprA [Pyrinomonadaceae bacterium]|nr:DNA-processing protein DprA [Pyrinomonadaceae bacterium]